MQKISALFNKYFFLLLGGYFIALFFIFREDYFFGDAISSTSRLATHIYTTGSFFYPAGFDPGHPPTYSIVLSFCWKVFGKTLWISHIYGIVWCIFLMLGFRKVCSLFLNAEYTNIATLLLLVHPTYLSQNAMMLNTAIVMGAFLWSVYFLYTKQKIYYCLFLLTMVITHLQGAFFLAALAVTDFVINYKNQNSLTFLKRNFFVYAIPFSVFIGWLLLHYQHSGWLLISPDYTDTHGSNTLFQVVKGFIYCGWRFLDYGMLIPFVVYIVLKFRNRKIEKYDWLLWTSFFVTSVIMSYILKNTIAHRYFLALELLFIIVVVKEISLLNSNKLAYTLLIVAALVTGNFIYYPGKTIADANIQYRNFFKAFDSMLLELKDRAVYSKAPIANSFELYNPGISNFVQSGTANIMRINESKIDTLPCVIYSNVCAEFNKEESEVLKQWHGTSFEYGAVYINLYLNPAIYAKPDIWKLREPGNFEQWMLHMKQRFK